MTDSDPFLPYGRQSIEAADIEAVADVLRSDWLTTGPQVAAFEQAFAGSTGAAHAAACATGTAALHLASLALRLGPDDAAIVPAITFLATANAVRYVGAEVVFADVDADTGLMLPEHVAAALEAGASRVKAVYPVHLNGQCGDPAGLRRLARERGIAVVEDACHALGTTYADGGTPYSVGACAHGDMATFSFHPVKTMTTGEGGMVTAASGELIERVRLLRNHGMVRAPGPFDATTVGDEDRDAPWYYEMAEAGFNYRLSDIQCALGLSQLSRLDAIVARRRDLAASYREALAPLAPVVRPVPVREGCDPCLHLFVVLIDFAALGKPRAQVVEELRAHGIGTQVHYRPLYRQPYYRRLAGDLALPGAESYYARCLSLPFFPAMTQADVARVAGALGRIVRAG